VFNLLSNLGEGNRVEPRGALHAILSTAAVAVILYALWYALFSPANKHLHGSIFLLVMWPIVFVTTTATRKSSRIGWLDCGLAAVAIAICLYYIGNDRFYKNIVEGVTEISALERLVGVVAVALSVEASRRSVGWGLTGVVAALLAYVWFGHYLPGELHHKPIELEYFVTMQTVMDRDGIFGVPLYVASTYALLFLLWGAFFHRSGGGTLFFDLAAALTGRSIGGPAKACVISSGLYGSISGSPTADVVTTGPITIPLMTKVGIAPARAGAIEAAASCGGAFLPPVMGSVAFIMAEFTAIPYRLIAIASVTPALIYYLSLLILVHFEAQKNAERSLAEDQIVSLLVALKRGWFHLLPIAGLIAFLAQGYSPAYVAAGSTVVIVILSWFNPRREFRLGPRALVACCWDTAFRMGSLVAAVLAAGVIIACIELSGLAGKFALMALYIAGDSLLLALIASAVILILLGMGMPTPGVYIMGVALLAPVLTQTFKVPVLETHMFMLYLACMSAITPPMAVACFAAATIANANPMTIGVQATRMGFAGFVLPFYFVFNRGLLLEGDITNCAIAIAIAVVMTATFAVALHGWIKQWRLAWWQRLLFTAFAVAMIAPADYVQYAAAAASAALYGVLNFALARANERSAARP
jgi:TRAP transporter 4TM/12TM fusion protein